MARQARKPTKSDSDYVSGKLRVLRKQMDKAEDYLNNNPWEKIEDSDARIKEFKFQKDLTDSLMDWTEAYINSCGIMDVYKQLEAMKNRKNYRGGQAASGIQKYVKSEALGENFEEEEGFAGELSE